ncbi:hypothetical protein CPAR01_07395 [Colletotrichum paranaense]|uniref:Uncharacterized protein n=1 Tax=Colletotrichum paranaense TaxID=1914294 RepID=A0ABQ9SPG5_9PEZI|nr:uncharacterized protein CPAR01_07395 [Colletotrichum paranaense]KAK1541406.1 hypothetical protein CPAR01_07395 [Colletotrichum paranaense]
MWRKRRTTGPKMGDYLRLQWPIMSVLDAALLGYLQELVAEGCVEKGCWSILSSSKRADLKELDIKTPAYTNNYPCSYNSIAYVSWYHLTKSDVVSHHRHITSVAWIKGVYHGGRPWLELQDERPASYTFKEGPACGEFGVRKRPWHAESEAFALPGRSPAAKGNGSTFGPGRMRPHGPIADGKKNVGILRRLPNLHQSLIVSQILQTLSKNLELYTPNHPRREK